MYSFNVILAPNVIDKGTTENPILPKIAACSKRFYVRPYLSAVFFADPIRVRQIFTNRLMYWNDSEYISHILQLLSDYFTFQWNSNLDLWLTIVHLNRSKFLLFHCSFAYCSPISFHPFQLAKPVTRYCPATVRVWLFHGLYPPNHSLKVLNEILYWFQKITNNN